MRTGDTSRGPRPAAAEVHAGLAEPADSPRTIPLDHAGYVTSAVGEANVIAETIIASVTCVVLGSLWLADRVVKRTLAWEAAPE